MVKKVEEMFPEFQQEKISNNDIKKEKNNLIVLDTNFLNEIKTDKSIEFYRIKRFPNKSTIIVNPQTSVIYQFVEVS